MKALPLYSKSFLLLMVVMGVFASCQSNKATLDAVAAASVTDSVTQMAGHIAKDVSAKGPVAWLDYFEHNPQFFMASDGQLVFADYHAAELFIKNTLVKSLPRIILRWQGIKVDPLNNHFATLAANFTEQLTDAHGTILPVKGYFTATAVQTDKGWKLHNVHWSIVKAK